MSELASAFVRIRPQTTGFKAEAERDVKHGLSGIGKIIGGAFAAVGIEEGVRKVAAAAAQQQEELSVVRQAIKSTDSAWIVHGRTVSDTLRETAVKFGFTVSDLAQGFTRIQVSTKDTSKTFSLLDAAMDISRARHLGLAQAAVVVAKAQAGNVTGLQRLGIVIPKVSAAQDELRKKHDEAAAAGAKFTKEQNLQYKAALEQAKALDAQATKTQVLSEIQQRFGGQAANFAKTAEGSSERFHEAVNELEVAVGNGLLPTLTQAAAGATKLFKELADGGQVQAFAAGTARELASAYGVVRGILTTVAPPLEAVARAVGDIAHAAGGGGIVAFALGFKSVSAALAIDASIRAKWAAVVKAGGESSAAAATAEQAEATALSELTAALVANTAALAGNATATEANAASKTLLIASSGGAVVAEREIAASAIATGAQLEIQAAKTGRLATVSRGLFALAGGWSTVVAVGLGAAAFGIYKLVTAEDDLDAANKRVTASTESLDRATQVAANTRARLAALTAQIPQDQTAVAQAKLNEETAKNALLTTHAGRNSEEFRQLQLNLIQAINERRRAEKQLNDDQGARTKTSAASEYADRQQAKALRERANAVVALAEKEREHEQRPSRTGTPGRLGLLRGDEAEARAGVAAARKFASDLLKDARGETDKIKKRNDELVASLAKRTGQIPTTAQIRFIFDNKDPKAKLADLLADLRDTNRTAALIAHSTGEHIGQNLARGIAAGSESLTEIVAAAGAAAVRAYVEAAKKAGGIKSPSDVTRSEVGAPLSEGIRLGILDRTGAVVSAMTSQVDDAVSAGVQAVHDAVTSAKQNLNSIGSSLAGDIGTLLDKRGTTSTAPTGAQAQRLKELLQRIHSGTADGETIRLAQQLGNQAVAKQGLAQTGGDQAERITRKVADLTDLFNRGSIGEKRFDAQLDRILKQAGVTPGSAQKTLGIAFADQLRADIAGLRDQAKAIGESPRVTGTGLEPSIVRPLETIREQQRNIADAAANQRAQQISEAKAAKAELKRANKHLADIAAHTRGTATITEIQRLIRQAEKHPAAAAAALAAAANRHGR